VQAILSSSGRETEVIGMTDDDPNGGSSSQLSDEEFRKRHGVPRQESYTCLSCGKTAYPTDAGVDTLEPDAAHLQFIDDEDDPVVICWECLQDDDWEERARQRRAEQQAGMLDSIAGTVTGPVTSTVSRLHTALSQLSGGDSTGGTDSDSASTVDDADRHRSREERLEWKLEQEQEWSAYLAQEVQAKEDRLTELREKLHQLQQAEDGPPPAETTPRGRADLLKGLFDIRDTLGKAMADARDIDNPGLLEGLQQVDRQIETTLEEAGIERIDTDGASKPRYHRTVATIPTDAHPPGEILEVYQAGYRRGDEILRPAHVAVAEPPEDDDADPPRDESVGSSDEPVGGGGG
jgi:molecular chaperone GrpE